jgi:hypothetical protein
VLRVPDEDGKAERASRSHKGRDHIERSSVGRPATLVLVVVALIMCAVPRTTLGNLFVLNLNNIGTIGEYTNSGTPVNPTLITGLGFVSSIAVSDGFVYVARSDGTIGKYTTSGVTINASLISGLNDPTHIAVSGADLYVAEEGNDRVGKYTTSGATVNASLITGLEFFNISLALSGTNLFVGDATGRVGRYTTSGATVDASLIPHLVTDTLFDIAASGSSLFVSHTIMENTVVSKYNLDGTVINPVLIPRQIDHLAISGTDLFTIPTESHAVSKYTTSGMVVAEPLITGLIGPSGIAVDGPATVPETLSSLWFGLTIAGLLGLSQHLRLRHGHSLPERAMAPSLSEVE